MTDVLARTRLRICAGRRVRSIGALFLVASDNQQASGWPRQVSTSAGMAGSITLRDHALALTRRCWLRRWS
jgi:hypothetical protein